MIKKCRNIFVFLIHSGFITLDNIILDIQILCKYLFSKIEILIVQLVIL